MIKDEKVSYQQLIDPELLPLVAAFPRVALSEDTLSSFRQRPLPVTPISEAASRVSLTHRHAPNRPGDPDVRLAVYRPENASGELPTILHMHGGGFVGGSVVAVEPRHRELCATLGCAIVSVDYRLAPETRYPGAIEDCYAALGWVMRNGSEIGVATETVGLMGESAGGGLAASLALLARDRGEHRLAFQHLIYPMLDDRTSHRASIQGDEVIWTAEDNHFGWSALLGPSVGDADVSPYAAAARAEEVSGLPPTYIMTGALDLFAEEDIEFARRLVAAGVPTELHVYPGSFHGFDLATWTKVGQLAQQSSLAALSRDLHREPAGSTRRGAA